MFVISIVMYATSVVLNQIFGPRSFEVNFLNPGRMVHLAATMLVLVVWRVCHSPKTRPLLTYSVLAVIDAVLTIALCTCWAMLGVFIPTWEPIEFSIILALTYTIIARSVAIPSTFTRTLVISLISIVPVIVVFFHRGMGFVTNATAQQLNAFHAFTTLWCVLGAVTSALNSRTIYGLRKVIREIGKLGQYTLDAKLGEGGMGVVYRASHAMLRRNAAIKLLLPERTGANDLARFEREVQLTSQLAHPNTVSIFDYGRTADGIFYYVMEYIEGLDLEQLVQEEGGAIPPSRTIHLLAQAAGSLSEAHKLGLIHRDIKPANIMITERADEPDVVKVVDFGLVKTMTAANGDASISTVEGAAQRITGTPMYLAPEAITEPDKIDARADIYALGAVAYFLATGTHLFTGKTLLEVCSKHLHEAPTKPSERLGKTLPADFEALILKCLEKDRDARPASAAALLSALKACDDASTYDVTESLKWWGKYKSHASTPDRMRSKLEMAETMTVDFNHRRTYEESTD
jgi:eukaryotic-like serine/threonine-protein kinase